MEENGNGRVIERLKERNIKIKSLIHFNNEKDLPDLAKDSNNYSKKYSLKDEVPNNILQTIGQSYRIKGLQFLHDDPSLNKSKYSYFGNDSVALSEGNQYTTSEYPFILGGQNFTIELSIYAENPGTIFYFSPKNYIITTTDTDGYYYYYEDFSLDNNQTQNFAKAFEFKIHPTGNYFQIKFPNLYNDGYSNSLAFIDLIPPSDIKILDNKIYLIITHEYKHKGDNVYYSLFKFYLNGKEIHYSDNIPKAIKNNIYVFNRMGFLYTIIGHSTYSSNENKIYFDEFRICDGKIIYNNENEIETILNKDYIEYFFNTNENQTKFATHFNDPGSGKNFNLIEIPEIMNFLTQGKIFSGCIDFFGEHQYIEFINRPIECIKTTDTVKEKSEEEAEKYKYKCIYESNDIIDIEHDTGITLGGQNFTIESFLKISYDDEYPYKSKTTIFEFNKDGCLDYNNYFRMIFDPNTQKLIIEQNNIISVGYSELLSVDVNDLINKFFHWFLCYHYDKQTLKLYIDKNSITDFNSKYPDSNYLILEPDIGTKLHILNKEPNEDGVNERIICRRTLTNDIKNNIVKYQVQDKNGNFNCVSFPEIKFQQFLLATNVAPMNNESDSYPYGNCFIGSMEEFRLVNGAAVEPYTPEFPYTIYDKTPDWDDDPLDYGPEEILNINFNVEGDYGPEEILNIDFNIEGDYGPEEILKINFNIEGDYGPEEILKINFNIEGDYGPEEILNIDFNVENDYGPKKILKIDFNVEGNYGPEEILKINFEAEKPEGEYGPEEILKIDFDVEKIYDPKEILDINFSTPMPYGPEEIIKINFEAEKPEGEYGPKEILDINFSTPMLYGPKEILKIRFSTELKINFNTKRIYVVPNDYLIIAVSFV